MIYFAGIIIALFLCLLLLIKKQKTTSDRTLAVWLGVVTLHLGCFYLKASGLAFEHPHLLGLGLALPLLHGPLLFGYVSAITRRPVPVWERLLHLFPFGLMLGLAIPFYRLSAAEKLAVIYASFRARIATLIAYTILSRDRSPRNSVFFLHAGFLASP